MSKLSLSASAEGVEFVISTPWPNTAKSLLTAKLARSPQVDALNFSVILNLFYYVGEAIFGVVHARWRLPTTSPLRYACGGHFA
jgi:hypothetical protein